MPINKCLKTLSGKHQFEEEIVKEVGFYELNVWRNFEEHDVKYKKTGNKICKYCGFVDDTKHKKGK